MRVRAIADLTQLADSNLFPTVASGLRFILANALNLWRQASFAAKGGHNQSATILTGFAEEEAAKFHILLDAIRCPRDSHFSNHLRKHFYDHLARGIYVRHYDLSPSSFGDVRRTVDNLRLALYLDGPEGFDWIFRNQIIERREQQIYVDYIQSENSHNWSRPSLRFPRFSPPYVLDVARALASAGISTPAGLEVVAQVWRPFQITDATDWGEFHQKNLETLESLKAAGLLESRSTELQALIIERWACPLWSLDLTEDHSVSVEDLKRIRAEAEARWLEREVGYPDY